MNRLRHVADSARGAFASFFNEIEANGGDIAVISTQAYVEPQCVYGKSFFDYGLAIAINVFFNNECACRRNTDRAAWCESVVPIARRLGIRWGGDENKPNHVFIYSPVSIECLDRMFRPDERQRRGVFFKGKKAYRRIYVQANESL